MNNRNNNNNKTTEAGTDTNISPSMSDSDNKVKGASKSNSTLEVIGQLQNMSMADNNVSVRICANCGKKGDNVDNTCNKCKMVKYCNAACKKKHRHKHKKECEEHARQEAEKLDKELFKQPPPQEEDCQICFLRIPTLETGSKYQTCGGKVICSGCVYAVAEAAIDNQLCPFCRTPAPHSENEGTEREKKRADAGDAIAIHNLGCFYRDRRNGFPQDYKKALELWHQAGELGYSEAYVSIGYAYHNGRGVESDRKKAAHYFELGAMEGNMNARYNLGIMEEVAGNMDRALKHHIIAARGGHDKTLEEIRELYSNGDATKEDYIRALQSYQEYLGEIKSPQRDKAAAFSDSYCYY